MIISGGSIEQKSESWKQLIALKSVYREQYEMLVKLSPPALIANGFVTLFTGAIFWGQPGAQIAAIWAGFSICLTILPLLATTEYDGLSCNNEGDASAPA